MNEKEQKSKIPFILSVLWLLTTMSLWALAFYRLPEGTPEWLLRVQSVCFGRSETGLPDNYAWILLALSPASLLAALYIAMGDDLKWGLRYYWKKTPAFFILLFVMLLTEGIWVGQQIDEGLGTQQQDFSSRSSGDLPEHYPQISQDAAPINLVDQSGKRISLQDYRGKLVYLSFAFAHCSTVCPVIVKNVNRVTEHFDESQVEVLLITLDPWRDTPSTLADLAKHWNLAKNSHILSGEIQEVESALDAYKITRVRNAKDGDVQHPALVYLINSQGKIAYQFNNPSTRWLKQAGERLLK